jgi:hypothetical protein
VARTLPGGAGERTLLASGHINIWPKLEVKDSDGTWRDLTNLSGVNWLDSWRVEESIDAPIAAATFVLRREVSSTLSLAPNLAASTINRNAAAAYVPLLTAPRLVRFSVATVAPGTTPIAGDYHEIFQGPISSVDPADPEDGVTVKAFDLGYLVQQAFVEAETQYAASGGTAVETVMQQIITAWVASNPTLVTRVSPAWLITTYTQAKVSVLQALRDLAQQIGWDVRYLYQAATNTTELRFYLPPRAAVTPDWTFGPTEYTRIPRDAVDDADVRNAVTVNYVDGTSGTQQTVTRLNSASITKFGRRWMEIQEDASSNIDSLSEAQAMADAAAADLGDPLQDHDIETLFFWPLQINDLCRFSSNSVQYDSNQDLACVAFVHEGQGGHATTTIQTRGKPAGAYGDWLRDAKPSGSSPTGTPQAEPPYPFVTYVRRDRQYETVQLSAIVDAAMLPARWQTKIDAAAYSALQTSTLPQVVQIALRAVAQKFRLKVVQADGQTNETEYNVPPRYDDSAPTHGETFRRNWGGLPTGGASDFIDPQHKYTRDGATPLIDSTLGQVTGQLGAADGVKGIESTRGARVKTSRSAGTGAQGISGEGRTRSGIGGMPTPSGQIHALHQYSSDGTTPLIDSSTRQVQGALQIPQSTSHNPQGSVIPVSSDASPFSYAAGGLVTGHMYVAWTWSAFSAFRPDGSIISQSASSAMATPPAPTLSQVAGGALGARTRWARIGYVRDGKVYRVGTNASFAVSANNLLKIASPAAVAGYEGWVPLVGSASGSEGFYPDNLNLSLPFGTDFTEPATGAVLTNTQFNASMSNAVTEVELTASVTRHYAPYILASDGFINFAASASDDASLAAAALHDGRVALTYRVNGVRLQVTMDAIIPAGGGSLSGGGGGRY